MGDKKIWDLPVVDKKMTLVGLLHLHPAIKKIIEFLKIYLMNYLGKKNIEFLNYNLHPEIIYF